MKQLSPQKCSTRKNALILKETQIIIAENLSEMYFYLSRALLCISWKNMISIYEHLKGTLSSVCIRGTCHDDRTLTAIRFEWYVCYNLTYSTIIDVVLLVILSLCMQNYLRRRISIQFWLYMNITFVLLNYLNNLWYIIYGR